MISLDGRLLCAAAQAYMIERSGVTPASPAHPAPAPSSLVGWLAEPVCYVGGPSGIDAVLIGETAGEVIVAFRGTEPIDDPDRRQALADWANDLNALMVKDPHLPGLVHLGFARSAADLWAQAGPRIAAAATAAPEKPLYVTGHSKGGALAPLAAMRCVAAGLRPRARLFAGARCGDGAFARAYDAAVPDTVRYECRNDIVPHLPPGEAVSAMLQAAAFPGARALGYASLGALKYIDGSGAIEGDSVRLRIARAARLAHALATCRFEAILDDHDIDPGSGYATAICPGVWT